LCCYNDRKQEQTGELAAVVDATAAVNFLFPAQSIFSSVP
jgi:hypothetical protein